MSHFLPPTFLSVVIAVFAMAAIVADPSVEQGRDLYRIYCSDCHGEQARGDGPTAAALETPPTDLTRLTPGKDGKFPTEQVIRAIDGRSDLWAHGTREMTIWGLAFQQFDTDAGQERQVRERLLGLVSYLESIQQKPAD